MEPSTMELRSGGASLETCEVTGIRFFQKDFGGHDAHGRAKGMLVLLNGIGLDREAFLPFLQHISLPSARMSYPYKAFVHLAPTVPGFEATDQPLSTGLLPMEAQAELLVDFIRSRVRAIRPEKLVIYAFSYGSDLALLVGTLLSEDPALLPLLSGIVFTEVNVSAASCFITNRIRRAFEGIHALQAGDRMRLAHSHFFQEILKAYVAGDISKDLMGDLAHYFSVIIRKNWYQLALNCREVSGNPDNRVRKFLLAARRMPAVELDFSFSDSMDLETFEGILVSVPDPPPLVRAFDATREEHFHHMDKTGILGNLTRSFPERMLRFHL